MLRLIALLTALALVAAWPRAAAAGEISLTGSDEEDPRSPPQPPRPTIENPFASVSFVLRFPSLAGVDFSTYPTPRVELGVQLASWFVLTEVSAYGRFAVLHSLEHDLTIGGRIHKLAAVIGDNEGDSTANLGSIELGYVHRSGTFLFGINVGNAIWADGDWGTKLITGELRLGHVF